MKNKRKLQPLWCSKHQRVHREMKHKSCRFPNAGIIHLAHPKKSYLGQSMKKLLKWMNRKTIKEARTIGM